MLIPVHFSIAGQFKFLNTYGVNDDGVTDNGAVVPGTLVTLVNKNLTYAGITINESYVKRAATADIVVGLAGDAFKSDLESWGATSKGYAADIVINGSGDVMRSQNRISDMYKETLASGKMTVYSGVGTFLTDQYDSTVAAFSDDANGTAAVTQLRNSSSANGKLGTTNATNTQIVGRLQQAPVAFPNGVPGVGGTWGTNWIDNSMSLGTLATVQVNI